MSKKFSFILMSQLILKTQAAQSCIQSQGDKMFNFFKMFPTINKHRTSQCLRQLRSIRYAQHTLLFIENNPENNSLFTKHKTVALWNDPHHYTHHPPPSRFTILSQTSATAFWVKRRSSPFQFENIISYR